MDKIRWCIEAKNGIELVEPSMELATAYIRKAEGSLKAAASLKDNRDWEISSCYYTMYFSLYAILMKIGVKCEIHSCTIAFMKRFLNRYFTPEEISLVEKSQKARIDAQYYSDRNVSNELYQRITENPSSFLAKCKNVLNDIDEKAVREIRDNLGNY